MNNKKSLTQLLIDYDQSIKRLERIKAGDISAYSEAGKALINKWNQEPKKDYTKEITALLKKF